LPEVSFCRRVHFRAAHRYALPDRDATANEARFGASHHAHAHDWTVTVWLSGTPDEAGMIVDLTHVDSVLKAEVTDRFAGRLINDVDGFFADHQPTNEVLAAYFAERLVPHFPGVRLSRLRVAEDPDLFAEWVP